MDLRELFVAGGSEYMMLISISGILMLFILLRSLIKTIRGREIKKRELNLILFLGSLSLMIGITVQTLGLFSVIDAIKVAGYVPSELFSSGLKISTIAPGYGLLYLLISLGAWGFLQNRIG